MAFLISVPDASQSLGISKAHLYKLIRAGKLPVYKLSERTLRVDLDELRGHMKRVAEGQPSEGGR